PSNHVAGRDRLGPARGRHLVEGLPGRGEPCLGAGEGREALHDHVDVNRGELEADADAPGHDRGGQGRARAEGRGVSPLPRPAVVEDRPAHALDRLLRAVTPGLLALAVAERVVVCDGPDRALLAVAGPMPRCSPAYRVPAELVLPVIVAAAQ